MDNRTFFKEAGFGFMAHFGLYSLFDGDYRGKHCNEWVRMRQRIPYDEYHRLTEAFNPLYLDPDAWVSMAKDAGMRYFVITSKHHDGFCLYDSKITDFNVMHTPYGKDIIAQFAESCRKYDMKFGLYYSQDMDWEDPDGGGQYGAKWSKVRLDNDWDYPADREIRFERFYENKVKPQVRELLTNYGDIFLLWFDNPVTVTPEQSQDLYDFVKSIQPDCLVNSRVGNDRGDYKTAGDNKLDMCTDPGRLYETPCTLSGRGCWCYSMYDTEYKTSETIRDLRADLNARGINLLLNFGPDHFGRLPAKAVEALKELAEKEKE